MLTYKNYSTTDPAIAIAAAAAVAQAQSKAQTNDVLITAAAALAIWWYGGRQGWWPKITLPGGIAS